MKKRKKTFCTICTLFRDIVGGRTRLIMQLISDVQSLQLIIEKCDQTSLLLKLRIIHG